MSGRMGVPGAFAILTIMIDRCDQDEMGGLEMHSFFVGTLLGHFVTESVGIGRQAWKAISDGNGTVQ
jgi:hypothetical protein